jgi:alpha-1,6-mannosyltransferase
MSGDERRAFPTLAVVGSIAGIGFASIIRSRPGLLGVTPGTSLVPILGIVAVVVAAITFLYALLEAWRGRLSLRLVLGLAVAYHVVILLQPLPAGGDVYSYAFYGRMMSLHHANPYVATPSMFPLDPIYRFVPTAWVSTPDVYGPLFTLMSGALARGLRGTTSLVFAYRLIAVTASLGIVFLVAPLARRIRPERAAFAAAAVGLNPLVLLSAVADAHNDLLVGLAIIGALWFVAVRRELAATALLTAGVLIKAPAAIPLFLLLAAVVAYRAPGGRLRTFGAHAAVAGGLALAAAAPFLQRANPTLGAAELASHQGAPAASLFIQLRVEWLMCRVGTCGLSHLATAAVRLAFLLSFLIGLFLIAISVLRHEHATSPEILGAAWGWGLLLFTLSAPVLLPWYVIWTLPLVWLLSRVPRLVLIATSVGLLIAKAIDDPARFAGVHGLILWFERTGNLVIVGALVWLWVELLRRWRADTLLDLNGERAGVSDAGPTRGGGAPESASPPAQGTP